IEDYRFRAVQGEVFAGLLAIMASAHLETFLSEPVAEQFTKLDVVIDQQYVMHDSQFSQCLLRERLSSRRLSNKVSSTSAAPRANQRCCSLSSAAGCWLCRVCSLSL